MIVTKQALRECIQFEQNGMKTICSKLHEESSWQK